MQLTPIALVYKTGNVFILTAQCFGELPSPYEAEMPKKKRKKKAIQSLVFSPVKEIGYYFYFYFILFITFFFLHFKDNKLFPSL